MTKRLISRFAILVLLIILVGCDHATKGVAKAELGGGSVLELVRGLVSLRYVENTDIAFNLLHWVPETIRFPALLIAGAVAVVALCLLLLQARPDAGVTLYALVLVTAGAIGNYLDRLFRGYVIDFVHLQRWPVFNVADLYITVGYALMAWALLVSRVAAPQSNRRKG
jgi:signal peptidase II